MIECEEREGSRMISDRILVWVIRWLFLLFIEVENLGGRVVDW